MADQDEVVRELREKIAKLNLRHRALAESFFRHTICYPFPTGATEEEWGFAMDCVTTELVTRYFAGDDPDKLVLTTEPWPEGEPERKMMRYVDELRRVLR